MLFTIVIFTLLINTAYAARQALEFSDVDVKVGSKTSKNLRNGDTIREEAKPGDNVEFRTEVKNNFTDAENLDIDDISVQVTIEGIDDGDDMDDESSEFDLRAGNDKRITLKFEVPLEVDEDTFDVLIEAEGDDENRTDQKVSMKLRLEVDKESHLLKITRESLSPAEISCNRKNVQFATTVINVGNEDEEDVSVQVLNPDLGVDLKEDVEELTSEPNEEESRFSKVFSFNIQNDADAGSYPLTLRVLYDDNRKKAEETATLTISDCLTAKKETTEANEEENEEVEVISPPTGKITASVVQPEIPANTVVTQESFFKSNVFVAGIIIAEVVAVIIGIALVVSLFRRKG